MKTPLNLKSLFLKLLIGSVSISALLGIFVIVFGNFGEIESKILLTTFIISCCSLLGLACGAYLETGRGRLLPMAGIGLAIIAALWWIAYTWWEPTGEELFVKFGLTFTLLAVACSHLSLISIASLDGKFTWSKYAIFAADGMLSALLLRVIWIEPNDVSEVVSRSMGVLSIVIAALTVLTPVFHRLSGPATAESLDAEIERLQSRISELRRRKAEVDGNLD